MGYCYLGQALPPFASTIWFLNLNKRSLMVTLSTQVVTLSAEVVTLSAKVVTLFAQVVTLSAAWRTS